MDLLFLAALPMTYDHHSSAIYAPMFPLCGLIIAHICTIKSTECLFFLNYDL